ncbi:hypothetical protein ASG03_15600 [Rhizobium sp. Leaf341]|nr:hypothetical protein ASG03_15600 [Rhizobium sp. Leaf341]
MQMKLHFPALSSPQQVQQAYRRDQVANLATWDSTGRHCHADRLAIFAMVARDAAVALSICV